MLKKELVRTQGKELERSGEYRQVLVQCVHKCAVKYPDVASAVVHILMEFLGDSQTVGAHRSRLAMLTSNAKEPLDFGNKPWQSTLKRVTTGMPTTNIRETLSRKHSLGHGCQKNSVASVSCRLQHLSSRA
jgi:hypothetical protein